MTTYQDMDKAGEATGRCIKKCDKKVLYVGIISIIIYFTFF